VRTLLSKRSGEEGQPSTIQYREICILTCIHHRQEKLPAIFRTSTNGDFTHLFSFSGTNGSHPDAGLLQAKNGAFYGTNALGWTALRGKGRIWGWNYLPIHRCFAITFP
jgi:hypothetical protein